MTDVLVHHLGISQSERIVWLCEELDLEYTLRLYRRDSTGMAPDDYRMLHPMGIAPVIEVDGCVLAESGAIIDYLVAKRGGNRLLLSPGDRGFADWLFWHHFANGTMVPAAMMEIMGQRMQGGAGEGLTELSARSTRAMDLIERHFTDAAWFAGDIFTTADIMMVFPLTTMRAVMPRDLAPFPRIRAYLARIGERPAYRRAMEACEPGFAPMLA
jgi:glutathione S-transferase